jgi:hypothetical protein
MQPPTVNNTGILPDNYQQQSLQQSMQPTIAKKNWNVSAMEIPFKPI